MNKKDLRDTIIFFLILLGAMCAGCSSSKSCPNMNWSKARSMYLR